MNARVIHLFALLSLRALADYDLIEFRRATDLSTRELDKRMHELLGEFREDDVSVAEVRARMSDLDTVRAEAESQVELTFHLRQLSRSTLEHAQRLALTYSRTEKEVGATRPAPEDSVDAQERFIDARGESFVRLAAMRLLRELPEYRPVFNYRISDSELDAVLEPLRPNGPVILIDAKSRLNSLKEAREATQQLRRYARALGGKSILAVVSTSVSDEVMRGWLDQPGHAHLLIYDTESNEFVSQSQGGLIADVRARLED